MNKQILVSDVGGTNGRFAIAEFDNGRLPRIHSYQNLLCQNYNSLSLMLAAYLDNLKGDVPSIAKLSVAGEVYPDRGYIWHHNWQFTSGKFKQNFGFDKVTFLNDYAAHIYAIPNLSDEDLHPITPFKNGLIDAPFSVIGAGSGFGAAIGVPSETGLKVISAEPGHMSFAPKTEIEREFCLYLERTLDHVSIDAVVSGPGLKHLYSFLAGSDAKAFTAPEITLAAKNGTDTLCIKTLEVFFSILGSVAGDITLAHGAKGGIYIGGGIVPNIIELLNTSNFMARFCDKGPMSRYVKDVPVHIITTKNSALLGAAMAELGLNQWEDTN